MKNIINWNYERASWQWDILCIVILIFIFATPKEWFENSKEPATKIISSTVKDQGSLGIKQ